MKGLHGFILALGLGIAGALFNFAYLANKTRDVEKVSFVGIPPSITVNRGERLTEDHLVPVEIPAGFQGNLSEFAVPWGARDSVLGERVWRPLSGTLLLRQDTKTPPRELSFGQNVKPGAEERAIGVPIDPRRMPPPLINPGDLVTFLAPSVAFDSPTVAPSVLKTDPAQPGEKVQPEPAAAVTRVADGAVDRIGPFKVLSLGTRLTSPEILAGAQMPSVQENVMTIVVRLENGRFEPEAERLLKLLQATNSQPLVPMLHPRSPRTE